MTPPRKLDRRGEIYVAEQSRPEHANLIFGMEWLTD
jgi:hypothetical protein